MLKNKKIIACDLETTGLDPYHGDKIIGFSFCDEKLKSYFYENNKKGRRVAKKIFENEKYIKVFHNAKFDIKFLGFHSIECKGEIHDTYIMSHLMNEQEQSKALKSLAKKYLGEDCNEEIKVKKWLKKNQSRIRKELKRKINYGDLPFKLLKKYAKKDAEYTIKLFYLYHKQIEKDFKTLYKNEMKLLKIVLKMENKGIKINGSYAKEQEEKLKRERDKIVLKIYKIAKREFNISSNKQLAGIMFKDLGLECIAETLKGNAMLDKLTLKKYKHPIVSSVLRYREVEKLISTYYRGLRERAIKNIIHCNFNQVGTVTGRFSSTNPNLQNIPRESSVRKVFVCRKNYSFVFFDYDQIEMKLFAHYAEDKRMIEIIRSKGDLHKETAINIFEKTKISKEERLIAKHVNFGIIYGIGATGLRNYLLKNDIVISNSKAEKFIDRYYKTYPSVKALMFRVTRVIQRRRHLRNHFGRHLHVALDKSYKGVNALIQGTAADLLKFAMVKIGKLLTGGKSRMILTIHDELVCEIHNEEKYLVKKIKRIMEDFRDFEVPITVSISTSDKSWGDKK